MQTRHCRAATRRLHLGSFFVFGPTVPCLRHHGNIYEESLELYEDSIIDPGESEPVCFVDSSNSVSDSDIINTYGGDSDYSPCDTFEGLEFPCDDSPEKVDARQDPEVQRSVKARRQRRKGPNILSSRSRVEPSHSDGDETFEAFNSHRAKSLEQEQQKEIDRRSGLSAMMPRARLAYETDHQIPVGTFSASQILRSSVGLKDGRTSPTSWKRRVPHACPLSAAVFSGACFARSS